MKTNSSNNTLNGAYATKRYLPFVLKYFPFCQKFDRGKTAIRVSNVSFCLTRLVEYDTALIHVRNMPYGNDTALVFDMTHDVRHDVCMSQHETVRMLCERACVCVRERESVCVSMCVCACVCVCV